jgi:hypothetical protein
MVKKKIFGPKCEVQEDGEECTVMGFIMCALHQVLGLWWSDKGE